MSGFGSGPYGGAPFGAGGGNAYTETLSAGILHYLREEVINATWVREALNLTGSVTFQQVIHLIDRVNVTGTPLPRSDLGEVLSDEVLFSEALSLGWALLIQEQVQFSGAASARRGAVAAIIDYLHASGQVSARMDAVEIVTTAIALSGLLFNGWRIDQVDTIEFQDQLAAQLGAVANLVASVSFSDDTTAGLRIMALCSDTIELSDDITTHLAAHETLRDQVLFYMAIKLGSEEYAGWVLNEGRALSEYKNYPFNGFVEFPRGSKRYYGTSDTGLYRLEGTDDDGTDIEARLRLALLDFGTGLAKEVPDVYIAVVAPGTFVLKVIVTDEDNVQTEHHYQCDAPAGTKKAGRFKVGRGLNPVHWQFELTNYEGGPLDLMKLQFRPVVLDKGRI